MSARLRLVEQISHSLAGAARRTVRVSLLSPTSRGKSWRNWFPGRRETDRPRISNSHAAAFSVTPMRANSEPATWLIRRRVTRRRATRRCLVENGGPVTAMPESPVDNGPGIPPEERSASSPLYRPPGTSPPGSGLGMAIVTAIADAILYLELDPAHWRGWLERCFPGAGIRNLR